MSSQAALSSSSTTTAVDSLPASEPTIVNSTQSAMGQTRQQPGANPTVQPKQSPKDDTSKDAEVPSQPAEDAQGGQPGPEAEAELHDGGATTEAARNAIMAHLANVGSASLAPMSQRAADIGAAHESITKQREGVDASTGKLGKESAKLGKEIEKADDVLKDLGNVDNWAQLLERDIEVLEETLRIVDEEGEPEDAVDEHGNPVERKKAKGKDKESWMWGLWPGGKSGS